jgi:hypothetical protein
VNAVAINIVYLLSGVIVVENVFAFPGKRGGDAPEGVTFGHHVLDGRSGWFPCFGCPSDQEKDHTDGCKENGQLNGKLCSGCLHVSLLIGPACCRCVTFG